MNVVQTFQSWEMPHKTWSSMFPWQMEDLRRGRRPAVLVALPVAREAGADRIILSLF